jgi:hypothetical protein
MSIPRGSRETAPKPTSGSSSIQTLPAAAPKPQVITEKPTPNGQTDTYTKAQAPQKNPQGKKPAAARGTKVTTKAKAPAVISQFLPMADRPESMMNKPDEHLRHHSKARETAAKDVGTTMKDVDISNRSDHELKCHARAMADAAFPPEQLPSLSYDPHVKAKEDYEKSASSALVAKRSQDVKTAAAKAKAAEPHDKARGELFEKVPGLEERYKSSPAMKGYVDNMVEDSSFREKNKQAAYGDQPNPPGFPIGLVDGTMEVIDLRRSDLELLGKAATSLKKMDGGVPPTAEPGSDNPKIAQHQDAYARKVVANLEKQQQGLLESRHPYSFSQSIIEDAVDSANDPKRNLDAWSPQLRTDDGFTDAYAWQSLSTEQRRAAVDKYGSSLTAQQKNVVIQKYNNNTEQVLKWNDYRAAANPGLAGKLGNGGETDSAENTALRDWRTTALQKHEQAKHHLPDGYLSPRIADNRKADINHAAQLYYLHRNIPADAFPDNVRGDAAQKSYSEYLVNNPGDILGAYMEVRRYLSAELADKIGSFSPLLPNSYAPRTATPGIPDWLTK